MYSHTTIEYYLTMQKKVNQNAYKKNCLRHATTKLLAKLRKYDEISSQIWKHFKSTLQQPPSPPFSMLVDCFGLPHAGQHYRCQHWSWGVGGRREMRRNLVPYFNKPFFLQNYASEKVLTTYFVVGCLRNIFLWNC